MKKEIQSLEDNLKKLVGNETGFSIPKSYFYTIEEKINLHTLENSFCDTEGFAVPDGYFENIENEILAKVALTPKSRVISLTKRIALWIPAAAATIALLFTLNFIDFNNDELSKEEIVTWLQNDIESITSEDMALVFKNLNIDDTDLTISSVSTNAIEEYLNNQEISTLLENY